MNHVFRTIWSQAKTMWIAVAEVGSGGRGMRSIPSAKFPRCAADRWCLKNGLRPLAVWLLSSSLGSAGAANLYWDPNGTGTGVGGGAGSTWHATNEFWNSDPAGGTAGALSGWVDHHFDTAVFAGSGVNLVVGTPVSANGLTFNVGGYTLNILTPGTNAITLGGPSTPTIHVQTGTANIVAPLNGSAGFSKTGTGTLILSGSGSTLAGPVEVISGMLKAGSVTGFNGMAIVLANTAGVALDLSGLSNSLGSLAGGGTTGGNIILGAATLRVGSNNSDTSYAGTISGTQRFTKEGSGTLALSGISSFSGDIQVLAGILRAEASNLFINAKYNGGGGTFELGSFNQTLQGMTGAGTIDLGTATFTLNYSSPTVAQFNGELRGTGNFVKTGSGVQSLFGTNTYTGTTTLNGGTLRALRQDRAHFAPLSAFTLANAAGVTLDLNNTRQAIGSLAGGGNNGGLVTLGTGTLTTGNDHTSTTFAGVISGSSLTGGLTKVGSGTQTLSGINTYIGNTTINGGTLRAGAVAGGQAFGVNSAVTLADVDGVTLDLNNYNQTIGSLAGGGSTGGTVSLGSGVLTTGGKNTSTTYAGTLSGSGGLLKTGSGTQTLSGTGSIGSTHLVAGGLRVSGQLESHSVALGDDTLLTVDGTLQQNGAGQTLMTGSTGNNSITIGAHGTLRATGDLAEGSDWLDVMGTLDTGSGELSLGLGDDILTLHDDTRILGTVDAGTGTDTLNTHLLGKATAGALQGFEALSKTGSGELHFIGPDNSNFTSVNILEGRIHVQSGATVDPVSTTVASGARLSVDGTYLGTLGDDTFTVGGTVDGTGLIQLQDGDDVLTLQDHSDLSALANAIDGGAQALDDAVVLDSAQFLMTDLGKTINFETLRKQGTGLALAGGISHFSDVQLESGVLGVIGQLTATSLNMQDDTSLAVHGTLEAVESKAVRLTGSAAENEVNVGAGGLLRAIGDLGRGNDTLDVAGTLDASEGALSLGDGDDTLVVHEGTTILGTLDGGAGLDTRAYDIVGNVSIGALIGFEGLGKRGTGTLHLTGPVSELANVQVQAGILDVGVGSTVMAQEGTPLDAQVLAGGTLNVDGTWAGSAVADTFDIAGRVIGSGTLSLGHGDDALILHDGANLSDLLAQFDGGGHTLGDTVALDNAAAMNLVADDKLINFEKLLKDNTGTATLIGSHAYVGGSTLVNGVLDIEGSLTTPTFDMINSTGTTTLNVAGVVEAIGAAPLVLTGSTGSNMVNVSSGAVLRANGDLGGGNDTLDVAGTWDASGGVFSLGEGDDTLIVHDGTLIFGTLNGGAGFDTRAYDLTGVASIDSLVEFEGLTKRGSGTLNLTGVAHSELVDVMLENGVLNIASGAQVIAQSGSPLDTEVHTGATLNVDGHYGCGSHDDSLSLSGRLTGGGTIDLCAGNDTLTLHDGGDLNGFGGIIDGGMQATSDTLVLDNAQSRRFDATHLKGFEVLHKINSGTATLIGNQTYALRTLIDAGRLNIAGTLTSANVTIANPATLVGSGQINGNVLNQGRIAPGNSIGTLNVTGDVTFAAGSTYGVEIEPGGAADLLAVTGAVDIQGGTVDVTSAPGNYDPDERWTIISASGGVTGTFAHSIFSMPFLNLGIGYDPHSVFLEIERNDTAFSLVAQTSNQMEVASGLDSMAPASPLPQAVASLSSAEQAQETYDLLSGEIHSTLYGVLLQDSRFVREATLRRSCNAQDERNEKQQGKPLDLSSCAPLAEHHDGDFTLWTQVFETRGTLDGHGNGDVAHTDRQINGLFLGADVSVGEDWRVGLVSGYERTNVDVDQRQSSAQIDTYHLGLYSNGPLSLFEARTGVVHSLSEVDSKRNLLLDNANQDLKADYDVETTQAFVELSKRERFGVVELEPFSSLTWIHQSGEAIDEKGGYAALHGQAETQDLGYSTLGIRGATKIAQTQQATYLVIGSVGWQRLLNGYTPQRRQQFATSASFDIEGAPLARDSVPIEAGVAVALYDNRVLSVNYQGQFSDNGEDHGASVSLSMAF